MSTIKITPFVVGELGANCYILSKDSDCIIIDAGDDADFLLEQVSIRRLHVKAVIATHGHFDHVMAAGEIQAATGAPFVMHRDDEFLIRRLEDTARHFLGYAPVILKPHTITHCTQDVLNATGFGLTLIHTPGHTPGSICVYDKKSQCVYTGDTVFKDAVGRYDFSYSVKKQLFDSIRTRILTLPEHTTVYPGHGDPTSVGEIAGFIGHYGS